MYNYSVKMYIILFLEVVLLAIGILAWGLQMFGSEEQIWREREDRKGALQHPLETRPI